MLENIYLVSSPAQRVLGKALNLIEFNSGSLLYIWSSTAEKNPRYSRADKKSVWQYISLQGGSKVVWSCNSFNAQFSNNEASVGKMKKISIYMLYQFRS
jgi:hypothetical protein